jgi:rod shape-determining protein MreC
VVDPSSTVGARLAGSRQLGLINGRGDTDLELQLLNPRTDVKEGDALVTFGAQRSPFVPGVPIGTVTSVRGTPGSLSRIARVQPYVDMDALDLVGVVLGRPADDPRDSLIPPKPRPTTAPPTAPASTTAPATTAPPTSGATSSPSPTGG